MIWAIFPLAWAAGLWVLVNNLKNGRGNVPSSWWWAALPFSIIGGLTALLSRSAAAGLAVGLLAAVVVHLWASARSRSKVIRKTEGLSYIGRAGVVTKTICSLDHGRVNLEGRVQIDGDRNVSAITVGTTKKVELAKGTRVRLVGQTGAGTLVVDTVENFTDGYLLH